jgi:hypothetical protein
MKLPVALQISGESTLNQCWDCRINCNNLTNLPTSIHFLGSCDGSLLRQNEMTGYDEGIRLESATIAEQFQVNDPTLDEEPLDNIWNDPPLANNIPTDRVTGPPSGSPINWYYRTSGGIYDPLDNGTTSPNINAIPDVTGTINCNDISNRQSRNVRFGKAVGDSLSFASYEDENTWLARNYAFESMKMDTTIMYQDTLTDINFINFFNQTDTANVGAFQQVIYISPDSTARISASSLNMSIVPFINLETNLQDALDVYLNIVSNRDTLTQSDTLLLEQIANLDYYSGGKAVYMAAAMLGKEVNPWIPQLRLMSVDIVNSIPTKQGYYHRLKVYPNPTTDFFMLSGLEVAFMDVALYDTQNKLLLLWEKVEQNTRIAINLTAGIYAIRVGAANNEVFWVKVVVMGR